MHSGFYCVIQFCPDPVRREGVNVGVVVGDGHQLRVRFDETTDRLRRMFPRVHLDDQRIADAKRALQRRLSEVEPTEGGLRDFIGKESSRLVMLPPMRTRVEDLDASVARIFEKFVAEPPGPRQHLACPQCGHGFDPAAPAIKLPQPAVNKLPARTPVSVQFRVADFDRVVTLDPLLAANAPATPRFVAQRGMSIAMSTGHSPSRETPVNLFGNRRQARFES